MKRNQCVILFFILLSSLIFSCKKEEIKKELTLKKDSTIAYSGSGNRIPVHYYWNPGSTDQYFTQNFYELGNGGNGWIYEGVKFYVRHEAATLAEVQSGYYQNVYSMYRRSTGAHLVTTDWRSAYNIGYTSYNILGFVTTQPFGDMIPLYGYINPKLNRNYYTLNYNELGSGKNDWIYKGIATYVYPDAQ